jgi:hypothetical protein
VKRPSDPREREMNHCRYSEERDSKGRLTQHMYATDEVTASHNRKGRAL